VGTLGGTPRSYSTDISYSPQSELSQEQFGTTTPIFNKLFYNSRGQLTEIREGTEPNNTSWNRGAIINNYCDACWGAWSPQEGMPDNNGNLKKQEYFIPTVDVPQPGDGQYTVKSQQFDYDKLNRLTRAYEGNPSQPTWQQPYIYDRYGNRTVDVAHTSSSLSPKSFDVETMTNHLLAPGDSSLPEASRQMRYDPAGNLINDRYSYTVTAQDERTYDAENRMTQAKVNSVWQVYTYDAPGHRVRRFVNNSETWQFYGLGGQLLAEYATQSTEGVWLSKRTAAGDGHRNAWMGVCTYSARQSAAGERNHGSVTAHY
jgi:YD repeat-containing protein